MIEILLLILFAMVSAIALAVGICWLRIIWEDGLAAGMSLYYLPARTLSWLEGQRFWCDPRDWVQSRCAPPQ
jgi:hypothetical protein